MGAEIGDLGFKRRYVTPKFMMLHLSTLPYHRCMSS